MFLLLGIITCRWIWIEIFWVLWCLISLHLLLSEEYFLVFLWQPTHWLFQFLADRSEPPSSGAETWRSRTGSSKTASELTCKFKDVLLILIGFLQVDGIRYKDGRTLEFLLSSERWWQKGCKQLPRSELSLQEPEWSVEEQHSRSRRSPCELWSFWRRKSYRSRRLFSRTSLSEICKMDLN